MSDTKTAPKTQTADGFLASDAKLKDDKALHTLHAKYSKPASDESVARTAKALKDNGHTVVVVDSKEDALKFLTELAPEGASVWAGGSTTLREIGFTEYLEKQTKWLDNKPAFYAALGKQDWKGVNEALKKGFVSDYWFSSVGAISEDGTIVWGAETNTRVSTTAANLVFVAGTNKIVASEDEAWKRLKEYQTPMNGALVRAAFGMPTSTLRTTGSIKSAIPFGNLKVTVVLVKGAFGF